MHKQKSRDSLMHIEPMTPQKAAAIVEEMKREWEEEVERLATIIDENDAKLLRLADALSGYRPDIEKPS
jgi:hypothetical protein